jgi:hypothetical protein
MISVVNHNPGHAGVYTDLFYQEIAIPIATSFCTGCGPFGTLCDTFGTLWIIEHDLMNNGEEPFKINWWLFIRL